MNEPIEILNQELGHLLGRQHEIQARFNALNEKDYPAWLARVESLKASGEATDNDKARLKAEKQALDQEVERLESEARSNQSRIKSIIENGGLEESVHHHNEAHQAHKGGFHESEHGWIDNQPVTFSLGWGTREGHTLIADGHISWEEFRQSRNHDHYGPGDGPNNNGTLRRRYTGPGS